MNSNEGDNRTSQEKGEGSNPPDETRQRFLPRVPGGVSAGKFFEVKNDSFKNTRREALKRKKKSRERNGVLTGV